MDDERSEVEDDEIVELLESSDDEATALRRDTKKMKTLQSEMLS
jgi:hypothetical protein